MLLLTPCVCCRLIERLPDGLKRQEGKYRFRPKRLPEIRKPSKDEGMLLPDVEDAQEPAEDVEDV